MSDVRMSYRCFDSVSYTHLDVYKRQSIVFAIMTTVSPAYTKNDLFHIVIFIVLFSISIQGTLLGLVAKKLDMIDENGNVMKTFSDYSDEMPVEFVKISRCV